MSCLFNSLQYFIPSESSFTIRQKICDYLQNNGKIIDGLDTDYILLLENPSGKYVENMRNTGTWGGAIEIQVACILWNLRIIVKNYRTCERSNIEFVPFSNQYEKTIELEWTGGHYEPVRV